MSIQHGFSHTIKIGRTEYTVDILIEIDDVFPYKITVTASYDSLVVQEVYTPGDGDIRPSHRVADGLKICRRKGMVRKVEDDLTALIGRTNETLS